MLNIDVVIFPFIPYTSAKVLHILIREKQNLGVDKVISKPDIRQEVLDLCELVLICRLLQITDISI